MSRALRAVTRLILPLTLVAAALALLVPSSAVAARSDLLLALLVLATALGIPWAELVALRSWAATIALLSIAPLLVLATFAWALGHLFGPSTREGLVAVGLSSSEVASVGLTALAGADATVALGAVAGSLVVAALIGPAAIGWLAGGHAAAGGATALLGRFALVVLAPLAIGVAIRSARAPDRWLRDRDEQRDGVAALAVIALVYASLSGTHGAHGLAPALLASLAFGAGSALLGWLWHARLAPAAELAVPGALAIAMRDFAVAAALATQAFGTRAATVPGVYGVVILVAGAAFVAITRRRRARRAVPATTPPG